MITTRYIAIEGPEGTGKTTQTKLLVSYLREQGYRVLETKEPGTPLSPLTMKLREIMLSKEYDAELTRTAREFISQAIRSIHLERVIYPAMREGYDFIIQDRGILSGLAYGVECGNNFEFLYRLATEVVNPDNSGWSPTRIYSDVVFLTGDPTKGLERAINCKVEFKAGDVIESKGDNFACNVTNRLDEYSSLFNTIKIDIDGKNIETVFSEIKSSLGI